MTDRSEREPNGKPEYIFKGSRRVRIAKGAGVVALCLLAGAADVVAHGIGGPSVHSEIVSDNNQPVTGQDIDGNEITLEPGTAIDVKCFGPHGYRFSINSGFWEIDPTGEGVAREHIKPLEDPFHADQAPGGPQDRLVPLGDC